MSIVLVIGLRIDRIVKMESAINNTMHTTINTKLTRSIVFCEFRAVANDSVISAF
jgi:hypothetical protein